MTALALEFGRLGGELERAGALVFDDYAREKGSFDLEERLLDRAGARRTIGGCCGTVRRQFAPGD
jgi:hypothetical protein